MNLFLNKNTFSIALAATFLLSHTGVTAATDFWSGTISTEMTQTAGNWSGTVPGASDIGSIASTTNQPHVTSGSTTHTFGGLLFSAGSTDNITFDSTAVGAITVGASGIVNASGSTRTVTLGVTTGTATLAVTGFASGNSGVGTGGQVIYDITGSHNTLTLSQGQDSASLADVIMEGPSGVNTNRFITTGALTLNNLSSNNASDSIVLGGVLTVGSSADETINGVISGVGGINKVGSGKLVVTNVNTLTGTSTVSAGNFQLAAGSKFSGTVNMTGGTLSGTGLVGSVGTTSLITGGIVSPGFSIGILPFAGNLSFTGGTYLVELNSAGVVAGVNNDLITVAGTTTLGAGAAVNVVSTGGYSLAGPYRILTSVGPLSGEFNPIVGFNTAIAPVLVYDPNNVYLDYRIPFISCAFTDAGIGVAESIVVLSSLTPTVEQTALVNFLTTLSCPDLGIAFEALSGVQYAEMLAGVELATHQFVRRLYDPLREFLARDLSCCECCDPCCCNEGVEVWLEGGGGQAFFKRNRHGDFDTASRTIFKSNSYQITGGAQIAGQDNTWVLGGAIEYAHSNVHLGFDASGNLKTVLGGLYGAYRMCDFYIMGDLVVGGSQARVNRSLFFTDSTFFTQRGKPESVEGILYAEFGRDFRYDAFLIQPFLGLEGGYFDFKNFGESSLDGFDTISLDIRKRSYGTFDTRLGVHLVLDEVACGLFVGVDLAWQYRCTQQNNFIDVSLFGFDDFFRVRGARLDPNSFEAALNLEQKIGDNFAIFASGYWQQWKNSYAYEALGGISYSW